MMNDDKKLTKLIDLCGRLPYGVIIEHNGNISKLDTIFMCDSISISSTSLDGEDLYNLSLDEFKPYLFPLSSMTEEQREEYKNLLKQSVLDAVDEDESVITPSLISAKPSIIEVDYFNKNHLDYRGLIDDGEAIDATNLIFINYKTNV